MIQRSGEARASDVAAAETAGFGRSYELYSDLDGIIGLALGPGEIRGLVMASPSMQEVPLFSKRSSLRFLIRSFASLAKYRAQEVLAGPPSSIFRHRSEVQP